MKLKLVQIGNSWGIRIPQSILRQCKFQKEVTIAIVDGNIVLSPTNEPRKGWDEAFKKMAKANDDKLLDQDIIDSSFDKKEWKW